MLNIDGKEFRILYYLGVFLYRDILLEYYRMLVRKKCNYVLIF